MARRQVLSCYLVTAYIDFVGFVFRVLDRPSRAPPEPCPTTGSDEAVSPTPNCQIRPARKAPYEIIRHVGLKLPSCGKKIDKAFRIGTPMRNALSMISASMTTIACSAGGKDLVSGGLLSRTIRSITAWVARVFSQPQ